MGQVQCTEFKDGARQEDHAEVEDGTSDNNDLDKGGQP